MDGTWLDVVPQIVWHCDARGERVDVNARWSELTGRPREDALGRRWMQAVHPDDRARLRSAWRRAAGSRAAFSYEGRMSDGRGGYRTYASQARPLLEDGTFAGWIGTDTDIDDRARLEGALRILIDTSTRLAASLDPQDAYATLLDALVPGGADWAMAAAVEPTGEIRITATSRGQDDATRAARALRGALLDPHAPAARSARSSLPFVDAPIGADWLGNVSPDVRRLFDGLGLDSAMTVPVRHDYRIVGLLAAFRRNPARRYEERDLPLFCELARRLATTLRNAETFEQERRVAGTFQRAALPSSLPETDDLRFDAVYEAGNSEAQVGGDWYDAVQLLGGRVLVSIGDVSGSGLSAAVTMGLMRQSIRAVAQTTPDPVAILDAADRNLRAHDSERIVTAFVGILDPFTGELSYAGAGHPPAFLRTADGSIRELWTSGLPLGLRGKHVRHAAETIVVPRESLLVLYTDGLTESTHDVIEGEARLRAELGDPAIFEHEAPAKTLRRRLLPNGSRDDVAILTVRIPPLRAAGGAGARAPRTWRFAGDDVERAVSARREFAEALAAAGFEDDAVSGAQLVFGELLGNAIRHGSGRIEASLVWASDRPVIHVLDEGPGFRSDMPSLPPQLSENGRGLYIVGSIAEDFSVMRRAGGGSHARAVLPPPRGKRRSVRSRATPAVATACESLRAPN
jgi:PAS domain S-box-containing protein